MPDTVWEAFRAHGRSRPDRCAVRTDGSMISYRELARRVESLIAGLPAVPAGGAVGVLTDDPFVALQAFLAASAIGCVFVPLGTDHPEARRQQILDDVDAHVVLTGDHDGKVVVRDIRSAARPAGRFDNVAYVYFTSGSTGRPKGVMISVAALSERLAGLARWPGLNEDDAILALTHPTFDIFIAETLLPLTVGAGIVTSRWRSRSDIRGIADVVARARPTVVQATPSWWRLALGAGLQPRGERIWCGGEAMSPALARRLLAGSPRVFNVYGPTEATIWCSAAEITDPDTIRLGRPVPGVRLEVDGEDGEGELVIHGSGLADGYVDRPEETARAFRTDDTGRVVAYRSGDRVLRLGDGSLEFRGRLDRQVKVRGNRLELGEVESFLEGHPQVIECAVEVAADESGESLSLVAFIVARGEVSAVELRRWLRERLPDGHVPAHIRFTGAMPRTTAGKLDRIALGAQANQFIS
ncbi:amino acid adenylation domain-containing protein [Catenuloplanes atrovinosus]|uniref:Amino acid adenylation domain-containing protein n=1 Tax=Catenuloplanes atrovinosus TaxID=137266 RepID=A0AAE3YNF3_9ACTN|nr:amino acid adenylation domain-containing protein [Catenuloplanes atrovinosus]MDR7275596.1 amino acid adenylation domain-containing protein [Catenuloplanes atrovinosus]